MQERGGLDGLNVAFIVHRQRARQPHRLILDAARVVVRDLIFGVDRMGEGLDSADVHAADIPEMIDLILRPAEGVAERDVQDDGERKDQDQRLERAEAREQHDEHRAENSAEVGDPDAGQMLAPDRQHRHPPLEPDEDRDDAAVQPEEERAEQQQCREQPQRGGRSVHGGMVALDGKENLRGNPHRDRRRVHVEHHTIE